MFDILESVGDIDPESKGVDFLLWLLCFLSHSIIYAPQTTHAIAAEACSFTEKMVKWTCMMDILSILRGHGVLIKSMQYHQTFTVNMKHPV